MSENLLTNQSQVISALVYALIFIMLTTSGLLLFFYYSRKKITNKEIENKSLKIAYQKERMQAILQMQEKERNRIAQDLHDAISAKLNVISLTTHMLLDDDSISSIQKESLHHILEVNNTTLESARKIAHDLLPPILDKFGFLAALDELIESYALTKQITISQNLQNFPELSKDFELHLFRIFQELISNSIKHGKATQMTISSTINTIGNLIVYRDNGCGFTIDDVKRKTGLGLQNIKNRVAILGGDFKVNCDEKLGTTFNIQLQHNG